MGPLKDFYCQKEFQRLTKFENICVALNSSTIASQWTEEKLIFFFVIITFWYKTFNSSVFPN